jgi:aspartyl-tRNA(Asn)/glutamyl-tRNA(Gln) amidotransferase subunit A
MTEFTKLTLAEARDHLVAKDFTATELTSALLAETERANAALNAYVLVTAEHALAQAKASDARIAAGDARPLEGLPLGHKDLFCTKGVRSTACSRILDGFEPAYESTVGSNLWNAGAVMLGKLNCDEFAMGSSNETSASVRSSAPGVATALTASRRMLSSCRAARRAVRQPRSQPESALPQRQPTLAAPSASRRR